MSDISAFQTVTNAPAIHRLAGPGYPGSVTNGPARLLQRFVLRLFIPLGSVPYRPGDGTNFLVDVLRASLTELDVLAAFGRAVLQLVPQMKEQEDDDTPTDERFKAAGITRLAIGRRTLSLEVAVVNQAGTNDSVVLPITLEPE